MGVSRSTGNRLVCYCDDCQAFAHFLERAEDVLDANGGTDLYQMSPTRLEITDGGENLACVRLTPKGILRWYADCCKTPIGNTLPTNRIPFVSLFHACMDLKGRSLDAVLGPVRAGVHGRYALGRPIAFRVYDRVSLVILSRVFGKLLIWRLRGEHKRSPFFDWISGRPVRTPVSRDLAREPG